MYSTILFDLDGTLTDPGRGITNSVAYALEKRNITVPDKTELYRFIGPPLADSFAKFYGFSDEECQTAIEYYREYFKDRGIFENEVYEGVPEMLRELTAAGKRIILATSKPEEFAVRILDHFELAKYFDFAAGATMDGARSKKADVIRYALDSCGITDVSSCAMIGDREHDILGAAAVGMDSVGVLWGYGSPKEFEAAGAVYTAENVGDILKLV